MERKMADGGHTFLKKTFHKPTYCHHCSDLLWGLIGQGYICEVCNFIIHERCVSSVVTPCSGIAPCIIKNPVAHCWSEPTHHKRKFCTVCRKRLDETPAVHCLICEYFAHIECQDFAVPDCTENATYVPGKELLNVKHQHHWREGNLPATSKCAYCKKTCWSSECLTGYRCEWCGMTTHGGCRVYLPTECNFGILQPIYLPPHSVSIPRTEVPIEAIIGVQVKSKTTLVRDYSCPNLNEIDLIDDDDDDAALTADAFALEALSLPTSLSSVGQVMPTVAAAATQRSKLSLKAELMLQRKRREISKRNFLLSSPSSSIASISPTPSLMPLSVGEEDTTDALTTVTTTADEERHALEDTQQRKQSSEQEDSALQMTSASQRYSHPLPHIEKSPSASSSLHLLYANICRRMRRGGGEGNVGKGSRRSKQSTNRVTSEDDNDENDYLDGGRTGAEDEDVGVCDISGDISDEYDHCDIELRRQRPGPRRRSVSATVTGVGGGGGGRGSGGGIGSGSDVEYHGDAELEPTLPREPFYETSDTTDEIDSSMNLFSNISYNSSNSNTSIENRSHVDQHQRHSAPTPPTTTVTVSSNAPKRRTISTTTATTTSAEVIKPSTIIGGVVEGLPGERKTTRTSAIAKAAKSILNPPRSSSGSGAKGGSLSSPNSSDCSSASPIPPAKQHTSAITHLMPVGRSKSFQEPGVRQRSSSPTPPSARHKKYARFFQRRRSKRSKPQSASKSNYSLQEALLSKSQNIEITIQNEDGIYQPYDDNFYTPSFARRQLQARNAAALIADDEDDEDDDNDGDYIRRKRIIVPDDEDDEDELRFNDDDRPRSCGGISDDAGVVSGDLSDGGSSRSRSRASDSEHVLGRFFQRMRGLSIAGWRKPRHHRRRARSISEEFSSGDTPRFKDEESVSKTDSQHGSSGGGGGGGGSGSSGGGGAGLVGGIATAGNVAGGSSGSTTAHYRPEQSSTGHKSDKSDKDKEKKDKDKEEKDIEMIKVFDGNNSFRRQLYRVIIVPRTCTLEQLMTTALRAFHITRDPSAFYMTDLYAAVGMEDAALLDPNPVLNLTHLDGKRPAIYLRFHDKDKGFVRVYPGKLQCSLEEPFVSVPVDNTTIIKDLIRDALDKFGLHDNQIQDYRCSEVLLDRGVTERILSWNERPWDIMKQLGKDSIRQMELMRFYMQHKQDPHGPNIALFVGNLPPGLSERNYEQILNKYVMEENKFTSIGPIYYEYGSVVLTFEDSQKAVRAFYNLRETIIEDKKLLVLLLPNIEPSMVPSDVRPLLVFVNVKSGGCQGLELISSFRKLLNPYQVFDLDNGGPLPGLYVFRQITNYKILVCGGDGTIGWVLQCLDNVGQDSECSSPPCAIVPLGTGNDLARVLCWGSGYTGGEDPLNLLRDVIEAEEIRLDRWTVVFHPEDKPEEPALKPPSNTTGKKKKAHQAHLSQQTNQHHQLPAITSSDISGGGAQNEDNSQIFVMNNYFGIGIDADLCLDFHNAREENPNKFNSRLHNKGYYVKMGLRKIVGRKTVKDLHKELRLEVDGKVVELPPVEGIIILNILSWGSGANPWGPDKDDNFTTPNHYDGVLEIVGVTGVVHLGQIQSGIRTAMRIAQGGHIKIHLYSDMPVQVDGEPWVQSPGDVVVLKSALKATMLKKNKSKMKRRNTEPTMIVAGAAMPQMSLALPPALTAASGGVTGGNSPSDGDTDADNASNNTDF